MTLRTLDYGNYGIFLIMGHAGFCPSTVGADETGNPKPYTQSQTWKPRHLGPNRLGAMGAVRSPQCLK